MRAEGHIHVEHRLLRGDWDMIILNIYDDEQINYEKMEKLIKILNIFIIYLYIKLLKKVII